MAHTEGRGNCAYIYFLINKINQLYTWELFIKVYLFIFPAEGLVPDQGVHTIGTEHRAHHFERTVDLGGGLF